MTRRRVARVIGAVCGAVVLAAAGCSGSDAPGDDDQRVLNSVLVGSYDELSASDSEAVSQIGLELVLLGPPLAAYVEGRGDPASLLDEMAASVDRIEAVLTPDRAPEVRATFSPYVREWRALLAALEQGDAGAADESIDRLRDLDRIRIDRVEAAFGEEEAQRLLEEEGLTGDG